MKKVNVCKSTQKIPTYVPQKANELPMFFEKRPYQGASGKLYPIPYSDGITDERKELDYIIYTLENEYVSTCVMPEIGGKILRAFDKVSNKDFIYYNRVVKPALVGIGGAWISGGIEFNWPQHHRPTTFMPLEAAVEENADGKTVWVGEVDPLHEMKGMMGVTVDEGRSYIKAKIRLYNRTPELKTFMWWANLAYPAKKDVSIVFPPDVEWVNDHDRRAVLPWPLAKGTFKTARPFDYAEGTDLSLCDNVKVPSSFMVSQGQSDMDFLSGYDGEEEQGMVTVANHHIAPGKKMWHWGVGDFGKTWCQNLTDEDGPYIELMTGVYTDNQPDFTWIAPYETKEFEQYWYPIRRIGRVKNATIDAALNFEQRGEDFYIGLNVTGSFKDAELRLTRGGQLIFSETLDTDPTGVYEWSIPVGGYTYEELKVTLLSAEGKVLVDYTPYVCRNKQPIDVREPVKRPSEIENPEELYINALHLEQYRQHNYDAKDYYLEGIKRDPGDSRCNTALSRLALHDGEFERCIAYADTAIKRLTLRNMHPNDTEALYNKGLALKHLGRLDEAYDILWRAAWGYQHRSAAYFALAQIDCIRGDLAAALEKLDVSIGLNAGHERARNLKAMALRLLGRKEEACALARENAAFDLLDGVAQSELCFHLDNGEALSLFASKPENILHVLAEYMEAGLYVSALSVISFFETIKGVKSPMICYYSAYCKAKLGLAFEKDLKAGESMDTAYCFPSTISDMEILEWVTAEHEAANACYYLGCLYYDRKRYEESVRMTERCVALDPIHGKAWRNLALAYFDKLGEKEKAKDCMEKALRYRPEDPRLLYEYQQLLKNLNVSPEERLAVYDRYPALLKLRDDCYIDKTMLHMLVGDYKGALETAATKHLNIYEGGEGILSKLHAWICVLYANQAEKEGKYDLAEKRYLCGLDMPASYGEAKTLFHQEHHIFYYLGQLKEQTGDRKAAAEYYAEAATDKDTCSSLSLWYALALRKVGEEAEAERVLDEMLASAEHTLANVDMRAYYGVGAPIPMPFEYDIVKFNTVNGLVLKSYALLGKGELREAEALMEEVRALDPYNVDLYVFDDQKGRI